MDVTLKVISGTNIGQELAVPAPRFFIGRAEDCQLRPKSDLISRHHCVLLVDNESFAVRDLGSRNGTFVNDERVMGERELKAGDRLKVGALEFVVHLAEKPVVGPAKKRPKVTSIQDVVARTVQGVGSGEHDVSAWLEDDPNITSAPTRELKPSDIPVGADLPADVGMTMIGAPVIEADAPTEVGVPVTDTVATATPAKPAAAKPAGKGTGDSGAAAADVLRQFFRRR